MAKAELKNLADVSNVYIEMMEEVVIIKPDLRDEVDTRTAKVDSELADYDKKVDECIV